MCPRAKRISERTEHHVDQFEIARARAPARYLGRIRRTAHGFDTPADRDIGIAKLDGIGGSDDGLQA
jgi:hypothetical protein